MSKRLIEDVKSIGNGGIRAVCIVLAICTVIAIICGGVIKHSIDKRNAAENNPDNPLNNETIESDVVEMMPNLTLKYDSTREYENILTYIYTFQTVDGTVTKLSDGYIKLEDIISTINAELVNIQNEICSIGIVGSTLYIQTDIRHPISEDTEVKMNIMTLKDKLGADDWLRLTEAIQNTVHVYTDTHINYQTELGTRHYIYVYSDITETPETVAEATEIIGEVPVESESVPEEIEG